jgi:tetratricopeptide (TPR) repeat protein
MDNKAFFQQIKRNVQSLVVEGKLDEAYLKCKDILQKYPQEQSFQELKNLVAEKLGERNKKKIKEGIGEVKTMMKEGKIEEGLRRTKELLKIAPNDAKLAKLYLQLEVKYKEKFLKLERDFIEKAEKELNELLDKDEDTEFLKKIHNLENEYKKNRRIQRLVVLSKEKLIKKELNKKRALLSSNKFDQIESMITSLKNIFDQSPTLRTLEKETRQRKIGKHAEKLGDFEYSGLHNINTLMKLGKYEEAEKAASELMKANKGNKEIEKAYRKAKAEADKKVKNEAIDYIVKTLPELKAEYTAKKDQFIKL